MSFLTPFAIFGKRGVFVIFYLIFDIYNTRYYLL